MPPDTMSLQTAPGTGGLRRIGTLSARFWQAKLYALALEAPGLRPEDLTAAERAYRAGIAAPSTTRVAGFAMLRLCVEPGSLVLMVFWWEDSVLHRMVRTLPGSGGAPQRRGDEAERIGDTVEVLLMACEAVVWRRHVLDTDTPSVDAYLAECCA